MKIQNIKNVEAKSAGDFDIIPVGRYDLMITKAEEKIARQSQNPYISLELTVMNDDRYGENDEKTYRGRKVWANLNLNEIGMQILKTILVANKSELANQDSEFDLEPMVLVGMKVNGKIVIGKDQNDAPKNEAKYFKEVSEEFVDATIDMFIKHPSAGIGGLTGGTSFVAPKASPFSV